MRQNEFLIRSPGIPGRLAYLVPLALWPPLLLFGLQGPHEVRLMLSAEPFAEVFWQTIAIALLATALALSFLHRSKGAKDRRSLHTWIVFAVANTALMVGFILVKSVYYV